MKKPWLAFLIAAILPGLGHFYLGKAERGLLIIIAYWVLFTVAVTTGTFDNLSSRFGTLYELAYAKRFLLSWITSIFIYVWQVKDAFNIAKESSIKL